MTDRFKVRPRQALIRFFEPGLGREVQAGKFCQVPVRFDLMQELDAWGVAPCGVVIGILVVMVLSAAWELWRLVE